MNKRLEPYFYKGFKVHHYVEGSEQFIACMGAYVLRANTKQDIEELVSAFVAKVKNNP